MSSLYVRECATEVAIAKCVVYLCSCLYFRSEYMSIELKTKCSNPNPPAPEILRCPPSIGNGTSKSCVMISQN